MSKEVRIRNVPDKLIQRLAAVATARGLSLEDYLLQALPQLVASEPQEGRATRRSMAKRRRAFHEQAVTECLATLAESEASVLKLRLGIGDAEPHTLQEIADLLGISRQRVHQIEASARRKLNHPARLEALGFAMRKLHFLARRSS